MHHFGKEEVLAELDNNAGAKYHYLSGGGGSNLRFSKKNHAEFCAIYSVRNVTLQATN
jgi:hypothetical protein